MRGEHHQGGCLGCRDPEKIGVGEAGENTLPGNGEKGLVRHEPGQPAKHTRQGIPQQQDQTVMQREHGLRAHHLEHHAQAAGAHQQKKVSQRGEQVELIQSEKLGGQAESYP